MRSPVVGAVVLPGSYSNEPVTQFGKLRRFPWLGNPLVGNVLLDRPNLTL